MINANDVDYKTAVAANLIQHRQDLSDISSTLNDTMDKNSNSGVLETQDNHTTELASHAAFINNLSNFHVGPAACFASGNHYVFVLGTDRSYYYRVYAGGWSGWVSLQDTNWSKGTFTSSLAVYVDASAYVHVYAVGSGSGTTADVFHGSFSVTESAQGWIPANGLYPHQAWENLGGNVMWFS